MTRIKQNLLRYSEGDSNPARNERYKKGVQELLREQDLWQAEAAGVATALDEPVQKHKITRGIPGDLIMILMSQSVEMYCNNTTIRHKTQNDCEYYFIL